MKHHSEDRSKNEIFAELFGKLNPRQKEAVDTIYGPLMIVAGPGTGKTQILSLRIANILKQTDTSPDSILALTFTESAAHSMRRRLVDIIGSAAYRVNIATFHSFCNNVINDFPDEFPRIIGARPASDIRQIGIVEKIILDSKNNFSLLKPFGDPTYYVLPALNMIRNLKRENISSARYSELLDEAREKIKNAPDRVHEKGAHKGKVKASYRDLEIQLDKNEELARIYELYEQVLLAERLYDYEDMILEAIRTLETNGDLLLRLQENYQFILADEHQDANAAQNRVLELLASFDDNPNICVVGDEKQAIFRFQGASLENFMAFKEKFPKAKMVSLEENYRSNQQILDAAHSLIQKNNVRDEALKVRLVAAHGKIKEKLTDENAAQDASLPAIRLKEFAETEQEIASLAAQIAEKIKTGTKPGNIAVIYRENRDAFPIIRAFENFSVPYVVRSDQNVLADMEIRKIITLFKVVLLPSRDDLLAHVLYFDFLGLDPLEVSLIIDLAKQKREPLFRALHGKFPSLVKKIKSWSTAARNISATKGFEKIAKESGFISHVLGLPDSPALLLKLDALFREADKLMEINRSATLADFISYIDTLDDYDVLIKSGRAGILDDAVELMTAHKSKGLEFDYVYIVGAVDKHWGNKRNREQFSIPLGDLNGRPSSLTSTEDERRLFYVALTRARKGVFISFSRRDADGREILPSQFIQEIDPALVIRDEAPVFSRESAMSFRASADAETQTSRLLDRSFLNARFLEQGLSVTALNNFLECPWKYFFINLIRLPRAKNKSQLYGTAVHSALKHFFEHLAENETPKDYLIESFKKSLARQPLTEADLAMLTERGVRALGGYFDKYHQTWNKNTISEYGIAGVFLDVPDLNARVLLRGKLDKIEFLSDERVNVVDYKTAKPQTRNAVLGATKNSSGDYFRQLVFYRLLLDGHEDGKFFMESGEIDFVEPNEKADYKKEKFLIEGRHIEELKEIIMQTSRDILELSFANKDCGNSECEFCALRKTLLNF